MNYLNIHEAALPWNDQPIEQKTALILKVSEWLQRPQSIWRESRIGDGACKTAKKREVL